MVAYYGNVIREPRKNEKDTIKWSDSEITHDYLAIWEEKENRQVERNINKLHNFNQRYSVLIPDKEYGDYPTWINVMKYAVFKKYSNWTHWYNPSVYGRVYQVEPSYFSASAEEKLGYRKYEVAKFRYFFKKRIAKVHPFQIPVNKDLPIIPVNDDIYLNMITSYGKGSPELNNDIRMIESKYHQLNHTYNKTLGRRLNTGNGTILTQEDLNHPIFKYNPVFDFIRRYKPLWNIYCYEIDGEFGGLFEPNNSPIPIDRDTGADKRQGTNNNSTEYTGNVNYNWETLSKPKSFMKYWNEGVEKLPGFRTSSDKTFYRLFVPHYIHEYLGRNIKTNREYKIALFCYDLLKYYSSALDKEGWYGKLYPRSRYKGEEGKKLRKEVKEWLKTERKNNC